MSRVHLSAENNGKTSKSTSGSIHALCIEYYCYVRFINIFLRKSG